MDYALYTFIVTQSSAVLCKVALELASSHTLYTSIYATKCSLTMLLFMPW
jgi:hypothetical protein